MLNIFELLNKLTQPLTQALDQKESESAPWGHTCALVPALSRAIEQSLSVLDLSCLIYKMGIWTRLCVPDLHGLRIEYVSQFCAHSPQTCLLPDLGVRVSSFHQNLGVREVSIKAWPEALRQHKYHTLLLEVEFQLLDFEDEVVTQTC